MKQVISESQRKFAKEVTKLFSFEELALCFYDNECSYCSKQHDCNGKCTTRECVENIREQFENNYDIEGIE